MATPTVPSPPEEWQAGEDLNFDLTPKEAEFLYARLRAVASFDDPSRPSLFARLVDCGTPDATSCWSGAGQQVGVLPGQSFDTRLRIGHGVHVVLKNNLLGRVFETDRTVSQRR